MIKCIIIDDEPLAIQVISNHISHITSLSLQARFENAMDAFSYLQTHEVDLIFLDIQMPKVTGLEFLKTLSYKPHVIFCTAFRNHALEGFELDAIDYLVKPIDFNRFMQGVGKVLRIHNQQLSHISAAVHIPTVNAREYIYVRSEKENVKILLEDILYCESIKNHVRIKTKTTGIIILKKISDLYEKLPAQHFIRVHRSFIIAINKIEKYTQSNVTIHGKPIPIGRLYKHDVILRLKEYLI